MFCGAGVLMIDMDHPGTVIAFRDKSRGTTEDPGGGVEHQVKNEIAAAETAVTELREESSNLVHLPFDAVFDDAPSVDIQTSSGRWVYRIFFVRVRGIHLQDFKKNVKMLREFRTRHGKKAVPPKWVEMDEMTRVDVEGAINASHGVPDSQETLRTRDAFGNTINMHKRLIRLFRDHAPEVREIMADTSGRVPTFEFSDVHEDTRTSKPFLRGTWKYKATRV